MLPAFLRVPPPQFSLKPAGQPVRVVVFGDFGYGSDNQKKVATAIAVDHQKKPFDFGLTTGDNFYGSGMHSTDDPRWKTWWEELYGPLGIKFYATLGNHDWYHPDSPAAEILYSQKSPTWRMPAPYYTFTAGSAQFFAIDTNDISEAQASWLREELEKSRARWKVVYGHYPIYHAAPIGDNTPKMTQKLFPILRERVDLYLAGHHHSLQHLKPEGGVHFIISGAGGASSYTVNEQEPRALFAKSVHGFTVLESTERELTIKHIGADAGQLYTYTLRK
jgi:tartrate-resistant acid phosphatase type 5